MHSVDFRFRFFLIYWIYGKCLNGPERYTSKKKNLIT